MTPSAAKETFAVFVCTHEMYVCVYVSVCMCVCVFADNRWAKQRQEDQDKKLKTHTKQTRATPWRSDDETPFYFTQERRSTNTHLHTKTHTNKPCTSTTK